MNSNPITNTLEEFKIVALALLVILLVISILGLYLVTITYKTVMNPLFFKDIMEREDAYYQIRQSMFQLINKNLPNGRDSIPHLENTISETWLKEEVDTLVFDFYSFLKGNKSSPPTISIGRLKDKVISDMNEDKSLQERAKLVQFWFEPLPDEVRLEDFMSIDTIWGPRHFVKGLDLFVYLMAGIFILTIGLIWLIVKDWGFSFLWIGSGLIISGSLLSFLVLFSRWLFKHMTLTQNFVYALVHIGISEINAYRFLMTIGNGFIKPVKWLILFSFLIGGSIVYIIPNKGKSSKSII